MNGGGYGYNRWRRLGDAIRKRRWFRHSQCGRRCPALQARAISPERYLGTAPAVSAPDEVRA